MFERTADGSILDKDGRVIYFSLDRLVHDICEGDCCFICGVHPSKATFNDEHVLPEWLLRHFSLFHRTITLPNRTTFRYDQYVIPCCSDCNALLGKEIETPVSELVKKGPSAVIHHLTTKDSFLIFIWMALIFVKTHLKDTTLRAHRDFRESDEVIGDAYEWELLHHVHCIARSRYTRAIIQPEVMGSFISIDMQNDHFSEPFDFGDLFVPQTMFVKLGDFGFLTCFNDSCGGLNYLQRKTDKIDGPISSIQMRELMAELSALNLHLKE